MTACADRALLSSLYECASARTALAYLARSLLVLPLTACGEAAPACPDGQELVQRECVPACGAGEERVGMDCQPPCEAGEQRVLGVCSTGFDLTGARVRLNSVGFIPERIKLASIPVERADLDPHFVVRAASDESEVFSGEAAPAATDRDTGELVMIADFTEFAESGDYYVQLSDGRRSPTFAIGPTPFEGLLTTLMAGLYGQRCGTEVSFVYDGWHYQHGACHLDDASCEYLNGSDEIHPATRGWHDAGDYGKYTVNGAFALAHLLEAWERFQAPLEALELDIAERGGALPDVLDEAKWQLDWLLAMQFEDGSVAHKVTPQNFASLVEPEDDGRDRFISGAGTVATADFAAVVAQAARIFAPYDAAYAAQLEDAAMRAWDYLQAHPGYQPADMSDFVNQQYQGWGGDYEDRFWAATELWETTGEPDLLSVVENSLIGQELRVEWDWDHVASLAVFTYALSERDGRSPTVVEDVQSRLVDLADRIVQNTESSRYGRGLSAGSYIWGTNGMVARVCLDLHAAYRITDDERYLDAIIRQLDHLLGRNYQGRSMVTGVGHFPPQYPHHRPSEADGHNTPPWPGLVVGGPNGAADAYADNYENYQANEVAINWVTPMIFAAAVFAE